jgi:hypothetical protein
MLRIRAHPRASLPVGPSGPRTGLYACIFFARGKKGYRFNPLRCWRPFCRFRGYVFYRKVEKVKEGKEGRNNEQ